MRPNLSTHMFGYRFNPTVLLLNGAFSNSAMWPADFISKIVDNRFCVVTIDHRDTGRTAWDGNLFTMDDMVDDIFHTMTIHRIKCPHIIGCSMGGNIAMRFALKYPTHCKTLCLYATSPGYTDLKPPSDRAMYAMKKEFSYFKKNDVSAALFHRYKFFSDESDENIRKIVSKSVKRGINPNAKHAEVFHISTSIIEKLKCIQQPTLIIHGENDEIFSTDHAWKMHHEIPNSKLYIVPNINHHLPDSSIANIIVDKIK